ncbi:MAG: hypothetical protein KKE39_05900 [Bacteroidetes bacterium]|nr:hypothetical protein [Bacteroidota bacterium]MBU1371382.1 hypothetical protein [Bacteroidota bacterium]MBU1761457.1 hypothetical protein [Bacteroidota bacterium]MBU2267166.1 hypothetical protein [Bacteroidota bacterium]MBU2375290.1 hypothetical protein [Bacteroidota bacterium]
MGKGLFGITFALKQISDVESCIWLVGTFTTVQRSKAVFTKPKARRTGEWIKH